MGFSRGPKIITEGLELYVDAANAKSYPGVGTTWKDLSGKGNHMTSMSDVHTMFDSKGYFTTIGATGDYWRNSALHKTYNNEDLTLSAWCYPNNNGMLWVWKDGNPGPDPYPTGDILAMNTWDGGNNPFVGYSLSEDGWFNSWKLVTTVWDYPNLKNYLYINGVLKGTADYRTPGSDQLNIGGSASGYTWKGSIASVMLHNRILTGDEIYKIFNSTKSRFGI